MDQMRERLLNRIRPASIAAEDAGWQQRKSSQTRQKLFEAAIDCLVENGYSGLSIPAICTRSGVSRGALHHHFAEKIQLVAALTEYLFYKRMGRFITDYFDIMDKDSDFVTTATQLHWESLQDREYTAYFEIAIAARTDKALAEFFFPIAKRFDQIWLNEMVQHFPQWKSNLAKLQLVSDFAMSAHMGLLLNRDAFSEERMEQVQALIIRTVDAVYQEVRGTGEDGA